LASRTTEPGASRVEFHRKPLGFPRREPTNDVGRIQEPNILQRRRSQRTREALLTNDDHAQVVPRRDVEALLHAPRIELPLEHHPLDDDRAGDDPVLGAIRRRAYVDQQHGHPDVRVAELR